MALIEFKDLPDTTTPLTADNLNNNFNEVSKDKIYSTNETNTGKIWIDNKPIYRKVLSTTLPSGTGWNLTFISLSNVNEITNLCGIEEGGRVIPYIESGYELFLDYSGGYIRCYQASSAFNNKPVKIIVEYTKTVD